MSHAFNVMFVSSLRLKVITKEYKTIIICNETAVKYFSKTLNLN